MCTNNFHHREMFGAQDGCASQAIIASFFIFWQAFTLALIAHATERDICVGKKIEGNESRRIILLAAALSAGFSVIATYGPYAGYRLVPSGTFCFIDVATPTGALSFALPVVFSTGVMAHRYYKIWKSI
jgi:hypothetical protein